MNKNFVEIETLESLKDTYPETPSENMRNDALDLAIRLVTLNGEADGTVAVTGYLCACCADGGITCDDIVNTVKSKATERQTELLEETGLTYELLEVTVNL